MSVARQKSWRSDTTLVAAGEASPVVSLAWSQQDLKKNGPISIKVRAEVDPVLPPIS